MARALDRLGHIASALYNAFRRRRELPAQIFSGFARVIADRAGARFRFCSVLRQLFGELEFRIRYLSDNCTVSLRAGRDTHPVTINNCFLPGKGVKPMRRLPR